MLLANAQSLLIQRMETISRLDDHDRRELRSLSVRRSFTARLFPEGEQTADCCLILSGMAYRYRTVADGRRQIVSLHFPGDMPNLEGLAFGQTDFGLRILPKAEATFIAHAAIRDVCARRPAVAAAIHLRTLVDASICMEWVASMGRRAARARVAHLICECFERLRAVDLAVEHSFDFPLTQTDLADATGMSGVHVNRTVQSLKRDGLISWQGKAVSILDLPRLHDVAGFDPGYLHHLPVTAMRTHALVAHQSGHQLGSSSTSG